MTALTSVGTAGAVARPRVVDDWSFVPRPQAPGSRQLVCFPHAGGDVTAFTGLAGAVAPELEVWAVRLPGRGGRFSDPMPAGLDELAAAVAAGIEAHLRPGAVFYGQSFGALLAYEVARTLRRQPALLVPAGAPAPADWAGTVPTDADGATGLLRRCGLGELLPDPVLRELTLATLRADLAVCRGYRYRAEPVPTFAVHAVAGSHDPAVGAAELAAWAGTTSGPFAATVVPGEHLLATAVSGGPADFLRSASSDPQQGSEPCPRRPSI